MIRRCLAIPLLLCLPGEPSSAVAAPPTPRPQSGFVAPEVASRPPREAEADIRHILLEVRFDAGTRRVDGVVTHRLTALRDRLATLHLDQVALEIGSVTDGRGEPLDWSTVGDSLSIVFDPPLRAGDSAEVTVRYTALDPDAGVYWNVPDRDYPDRPMQIWTQGQTRENRHWFPHVDHPSDFATSETIVTVRDDYRVIGNGTLVEVAAHDDGTSTWHHRMDVPHSSYLLSLVVGDFEVIEERLGGIPVESYYDARFEGEAQIAYANTLPMMRMLEKWLETPYPYPVYRQVAVDGFVWGGMENVTAATLTDRTFHPARIEPSYSSDPLIVHEVSHMWYGDYISNAEWDHLWLSEGFATLAEWLWDRQEQGPEAAAWRARGWRTGYLRSDRAGRRPITTPFYEDPDDLFDSVGYDKAALVLGMLRDELGEESFRKALGSFMTTLGPRPVDSESFRRHLEAVTGFPLERFFEQWVYRGGHPEFEVRWIHDAATGEVTVTVEQMQEVDALTPWFAVNVPIEIVGEGWVESRELHCDSTRVIETIAVPGPPKGYLFDPDDRVLKTLSERMPRHTRLWQAEFAPTLPARLRAIEALGEADDDEARKILKRVLLDADVFHGAREVAAAALREQDHPFARNVLLTAVDTADPRVRKEVVKALQAYPDEHVADRLRVVALHDPDPYVADQAMNSIGRMGGASALEVLESALREPGWQERRRRGALKGLAELEQPEGIELSLPWSEAGHFRATRVQALRTLASLGSRLEPGDPRYTKVFEALLQNARDPLLDVRWEAVDGLGTLGDREAIPILERIAAEDQYLVAGSARSALASMPDSSGGD